MTVSRRRFKKSLRIFLKWIIGGYLFCVVAMLVADRFVQFRNSDTEILEYFVKKNQPIQIQYYTALGREMRFIYTENNPAKPVILFIHGAPSSSSYYRNYFSDPEIRSRAALIAVDRPGYGYSGFGDPEPDIAKQAAMIRPVLDSLQHSGRPVVVMGASYGTSIASRLTMDYPELVDGLVLVAPSLAPGEEKIYGISYVLESPFFRYVQPRMIHSANVEKFDHRRQLEAMEHRWHEIKVPVMYLQGANDELIYTSNATFARNHITNSACLDIEMIPGRGHLIAFNEQKRIKKALLSMLDLSEKFYAQRTGVKKDSYQAGITNSKISSIR